LLIFLVFCLNSTSLLAISDFNVYVGSHERKWDGTGYLGQTNMVLEFTLETTTNTQGGTFVLQLDDDDDLNSNEAMFSAFSGGLDTSVYLVNLNGAGADVMYKMDTTSHEAAGQKYLQFTIPYGDTLEFGWSSSVGDFDPGDVIRVYIGDSDTGGTGGVSGVYPSSLGWDGDANVNIIYQDGYSSIEDVGVYLKIFSEYFESTSGSYAIEGDAEAGLTEGAEIKLENAESLSLKINKSIIDLGVFDHTEMGTDDSLTLEVATNSANGLVLRMRANNFETSNNEVISAYGATAGNFVLGNTYWGVNFRNNDGSVGDVGGLGTIISPSGYASGLATAFNSSNKFAARDDDIFMTILTYASSMSAVLTMSTVVSVSELVAAGNYSGNLLFNLYANF